MTGISIDTALLIALGAAALFMAIVALRMAEWLSHKRTSSAEARLLVASRATESWSTPLALAPILEVRRVARERDYSLTTG